MRQIMRKRKPEPTIALINIVFLMLIFFLVAGTLAQPLDGDLDLIETRTLEGREPPDALVIGADGTLSYRGAPLADVATFLQDKTDDARAAIRIVPDRALAADRLVEVAQQLRSGGAQSVIIVTERALQ